MDIRITDKSKQAHVDAVDAPEVFWQQTAGGNDALEFAEQVMRDGGLSPKDLHTMRLKLPIGATGTTGSRVLMIDRLLKRLEKETSH
jgi:hypothetical protein